MVEAAELAAEADIDPPADLHASAEFRRHLVRVLVRRVVHSAGRSGVGRRRGGVNWLRALLGRPAGGAGGAASDLRAAQRRYRPNAPIRSYLEPLEPGGAVGRDERFVSLPTCWHPAWCKPVWVGAWHCSPSCLETPSCWCRWRSTVTPAPVTESRSRLSRAPRSGFGARTCPPCFALWSPAVGLASRRGSAAPPSMPSCRFSGTAGRSLAPASRSWDTARPNMSSFLLFWALNMYFVYAGTESIRWLETVTAPFLIVVGVAPPLLGGSAGRRHRSHPGAYRLAGIRCRAAATVALVLRFLHAVAHRDGGLLGHLVAQHSRLHALRAQPARSDLGPGNRPVDHDAAVCLHWRGGDQRHGDSVRRGNLEPRRLAGTADERVSEPAIGLAGDGSADARHIEHQHRRQRRGPRQ